MHVYRPREMSGALGRVERTKERSPLSGREMEKEEGYLGLCRQLMHTESFNRP